jgi:hypothetical protein
VKCQRISRRIAISDAAIENTQEKVEAHPFPAWRLENGVINASNEQLETSATSCERWSWGFGAIVFVGVIVEFVLAGINLPYSSPLERWGNASADGFVAIGVAGEILFAFLAFRRQEVLSARSKKEVSEARERAAEALKAAGEANDRAAASELQLEQLRGRVGTRLIPRDAFLEAMRDKPKPRSVIISYAPTAGDGWYLAFQMDQLLRQAGWSVRPGFETIDPSKTDFPVGVAVAHGGSSSGIIVLSHWGAEPHAAETPRGALIGAIRDTLGAVSGGQYKPVPEGVVKVVIFPRP